MPSYLTFSLTENFRNKLLARNLSPYSVPGVYTPPSQDIAYETVLRDEGIYNSPDNLIADDPFADKLYPLNAYGPEGGYNKSLNVGGLANTKSNLGPYDVMDASLPEQSLTGKGWPQNAQVTAEKNIPSLNKYSFDEVRLESIDNIQFVPLFSFYANPQPVSFNPSSYNAYDILLSNDPTGDNGNLSQDSYIAQLGAKELQKILKKRQSVETALDLNNQNAGDLSAIQNGATDILRGNSNLSNTDYRITTESNPNNSSGTFLNRISGNYVASSPIPGDYFQDEQYIRYSAVAGQIGNALNIKTILGPVNQYLGPKVIRSKSPSEVFLLNTSSGQSSQLFRNLSYNKYKPNYRRTLAQDFLQGALNVLGVSNQIDVPTNYYVGSSIQDPSFVSSPLGQVPYDSLGRDTQAIVIGPTAMSNLYENNSTNRAKFGLNGSSLNDGGGLSGGLVWVSPKYDNTGYKATVGGDQGPQSPSFIEVKSSIDSVLSESYLFKEDSILDNTQKLLDSTPRGGKRLGHVGNAINQLSKVFNDGYREITKGSQVLGYTNPQQGKHVTDNVYCRVFAKDVPYLTFQDLQKTDGNIRKYAYSVLDNTYNLNIAPFKNPGSTNIVNGKVKKYMFSIENLAWKTSNRAGLTYSDLPECERGPNGGRIMWFPPYDISFNETVTPTFSENNFLGRPEPIYTYQNTKRSGSLSWKIIVDHPSIINLIIDKELKSENPQRINSIMDSFFAGCLKYDIYELAKRWNTIPPDQLYITQQIITQSANREVTETALREVGATGTQETPTNGVTTKEDVKVQEIPLPDLSKFVNVGFYFDNDQPDPNTRNTTTTTPFNVAVNNYIAKKQTYINNSKSNSAATESFFNNVIIDNWDKIQNGPESLISKLEEFFNTATNANGNLPTVVIELEGSASAPATKNYNVNLSKRRIDCVLDYFNSSPLSGKVENKQIIILPTALGESGTSTVVDKNNSTLGPYSCTDNDTNKTTYDKIYSVNAMACRRVYIKNIKANGAPGKKEETKPEPKVDPVNDRINAATPKPTYESFTRTYSIPQPATINIQKQLREGISKKILRYLLTECNYFELLKETNPMYYDSMKEKIKYFTPAFHSITPEGLNSRLTFLQQCTRPGDTIPIIGPDGKAKYSNAVNTNFGAPPVLVLRVGDFYHSKIIPTSLSISYEPLVFDINPEGIGVQPMIAKINLNFNFVGGQGLKEPIDKLQNALSFNFYGNTEMYDERADWTDDSFKKIDEDLVKAIQSYVPPPTPQQNNNLQNEGGDTIGEIQEKSTNLQTPSGSGTTGTTTFQKVMSQLYDNGQSYINSFYNKTRQIIENNNLPTETMYSSTRLYVDGVTKEFTTASDLKIFGKSSDYQNNVQDLVDAIVDDIQKVDSFNDSGFFFIRRLYQLDFKKSTIRNVKRNLINQVKLAQANMLNQLTSVNNELVTNQVSMVKTFRKIDIVDTLTDGYIKPDQSVKIYNLTATTEVLQGSGVADTHVELTNDYTSATTKLNSFYNLMKNNNFIDVEFDVTNIVLKNTDGTNIFNEPIWKTNPSTYNFEQITGSVQPEYRFYMLMSRIMLNEDLYQSFRNSVIPSSIANEKHGTETLMGYFDAEFERRKRAYKAQHDNELKIYDDKITKTYNDNYKTWLDTSFKQKVRKFTFSDFVDGTGSQKQRFVNLYKNGNSNTSNKTFNGKNTFL